MTTKTNGRSLELFFIDGNPDGMLTAEVFNWTGHVLRTPRTQIGEALSRQEASYTGVYILLGEQDGEPMAYIGEGENIAKRIKSHEVNKDWWTDAVLITTGANNLHKAHVQFLEARLVEEAKSAATTTLENNTTPARPSLPEAARANLESFLDYLFTVLPAIRVDLFIQKTRSSKKITESTPSDDTHIHFELITRKNGIHATAHIEHGEFVVQVGSTTRGAWEGQGSKNSTYAKLFAQLIHMGILNQNGSNCVFSQNYAFSSPSAAGAVVNGRATNGTIEWKVKGANKTYKQWEAEGLKARADTHD